MESSFIWILPEFVVLVHQQQIARFGGVSGIRDPGLLDSALARPRQRLEYGDPPPDLVELAAVYAFGIARNHPFLDGNKRTALAVMLTFLERNGLRFVAPESELIDVFLRLASGTISENELTEWVRSHVA